MQRSTHGGTFAVQSIQVVGNDRMTAECTLSEIRHGEWLVLGSVREADDPHRFSERIVVGLGPSRSDALAQVERELRRAPLVT